MYAIKQKYLYTEGELSETYDAEWEFSVNLGNGATVEFIGVEHHENTDLLAKKEELNDNGWYVMKTDKEFFALVEKIKNKTATASGIEARAKKNRAAILQNFFTELADTVGADKVETLISNNTALLKSYVNTNSSDLATTVTNSNASWLDTLVANPDGVGTITIRQKLLNAIA